MSSTKPEHNIWGDMTIKENVKPRAKIPFKKPLSACSGSVNNFKIINKQKIQKMQPKLALFDESSDDYDHLLTKHLPQDLLDSAYRDIDNGNQSHAINTFNEIIRHPASDYVIKAKCHDMIAQLLSGTTQIARALSHIKKAQQISKSDQEFPYLYQTLGRIQRNIGEIDLAIENFTKFKQLDPTDLEVDHDITECQQLLTKFEPFHCKRYLVEGCGMERPLGKDVMTQGVRGKVEIVRAENVGVMFEDVD